MTRIPRTHQGLLSTVTRLVTLLVLALAFTSSLAIPNISHAQTEEELMAKKTEWQERYRRLLQDAAHYENNARISRDNYARAQRRNYPRGDARQQFLVQADQAETELAKVKTQLEQIFDQARSEGIPPGWLYEVDDEPISIPQPAAPSAGGNAGDEGQDDDDGRNPLYSDDDDGN